jgi:hypothetical protein
VIEDEKYWSFISEQMRKAPGLEMETAALGALAQAHHDLCRPVACGRNVVAVIEMAILDSKPGLGPEDCHHAAMVFQHGDTPADVSWKWIRVPVPTSKAPLSGAGH